MKHLLPGKCFFVLHCEAKMIKMDQDKLRFITKDCVRLFNKLQADTAPGWGKMNAQQMLEHVAAFFNVSTGKLKFELVTPEEHLPKFKAFLLSDKEFRENTKAPVSVIGEEPLPLSYATLQEALDSLTDAIAYFEIYFNEGTGKKTMHPVFGELNYEEWVLLHYKHVRHHLKQFGLL